jgi:very-short-patch-repair endonuclease
VERRIAALAARQHGAIARDQLRALGLSDKAINRRLACGRLVAVHRGSFLVAGAVQTIATREFAAVLACRPARAFVSHRSAAYRLALLPYPAHYRLVEVSTTQRGVASRRGVRVHFVKALGAGDTIRAARLPITSIKRTLLDLAAVTAGRELERALAAAQRDHKLHPSAMLAYLDPHRHRSGVGRLRRLLSRERSPAFTRSEPEERLLALIRGTGLPEPRANVRVGRYEVDLVWSDARLVVEVDGWRWHGDRQAASRDKRRDAELAALGYRVIRVTWDRLVDEPNTVVAQIARAVGVAPVRVRG